MTESEFRLRRRQKFLTEKFFCLNSADISTSIKNNETALAQERESAVVNPASFGSRFKNTLKLLRLHYTAGDPIGSLVPMYGDVIRCFDAWHAAYRQYIAGLARDSGDDLRTDGTPLHFEDLFHFQLLLDTLCIGVLLGEGDAVRRSAEWLERYRGTDMLVEYLLETIVPDPRDIETFFHERPYGPLVDAIYTADTPEESQAYVKQYLDGWYQAFEGVPWHNGHLVVTEEYSAYEGYWAFEAAAVCVLHGIDDSTFRDHMVYPKDLADWARAHNVVEHVKLGAGGNANAALRIQAGQPCDRSGFWFTPAKASSRRHFNAGEVMPDVGGDYGVAIWHWDEHQN